VPDDDAAGIELDTPLAESLVTDAAGAFSAPDGAESAGRFRFLEDAPPQKLALFLEREHPQTIAVVMSHLPTDRAAAILSYLPPASQTEVARRLLDLDETDAESLREVERGLQKWLNSHVRGERRRTEGVAALSGILGAADPQARQRIISSLARHDGDLAAKLDVPAGGALKFSDLERMDSASMAVVLRQVEPELLSLALAGAPPQLAQRAIAMLNPTAACGVRAALSNLGPTRLSDVEEAQRRLAELASELELRGEITPAVRGRLSVAV
jgi:flagellar motor switch protein FliG